MNAGDIVIELSLDNGQFRIAAKDTERGLTGIASGVDKAAKGVQKLEQHYSSMGASLRRTVMGFAAIRFAVMDFYDVVLRLPLAFIKTSAELERMQVLMEGLSGKTGEAAKQWAIAQKGFVIGLAQRAPFEIKAITDAFVKMKSAGLDPTDGSLKALIDGVARFGGTSETLHRASVAIQQMAGKGVISMEELRQQLGEAVPTAMQLMADGAGVSVAKLVKHIAKGEVGAREALERMFAMMRIRNEGAAALMMKTWTGTLARLQTRWQLFQDQVVQTGGMQELKKQVNDLINSFDSISGKRMAASLGELLKGGVGLLRTTIDMLIEYAAAIRTAGEMFIAYWGVSKLAALSQGFKAFYTERLAGLYKTTAIELGTEAGLVRSKAALRMKAAQDELTAGAERIREHRAILSTMTMQEAAFQQKVAANQLAMDTIARRQGWLGQQGAPYKALNREMENSRQATLMMAGPINARKEQIKALDAEAMATRRMIVEQAGLASGATKVSAAARAGTIAMTAWNGAIALLGGGFSALLIGVALVGYAFYKMATAAEESLERMRVAVRNGIADDSTVKALQKEKDKLQKVLANPVVGEYGEVIDQSKLKKRLEEIESLIPKAQDQAKSNTLTQVTEAEQRIWDKSMQEMLDKKILNIGEIDAAENKALEHFAGTEEQRAEIHKKYRDQAVQKEIEYESAKLAAIKQGLRNIDVAMNDREGRGAGRDALEVNRQALLKMQASANSNLTTLNQMTSMMKFSPKDKGDKLITPFERMVARAKADLAAAEESHQFMMSTKKEVDSYDRIYKDVLAERLTQRDEGALDTIRDKKAVRPSVTDVQALAKIQAQAKYLDKLDGLIGQATQKRSELETERDLAVNELINGTTVTTNAAIVSLDEFFTKLTNKIALSKEVQEKIAKLRQDSMVALAQTEASKAGVEWRNQSKDINNSLIIDYKERARQQGVVDRTAAIDRYNQLIASMTKEGLTRDQAVDRTKASADELAKYLASISARIARETETPLQALARSWLDVTNQMEQASVQWANRSVDAFMNFVTTGKFEFKQLAESILTDILRIQTQRMMASAATGLFGFADGGIMSSRGPLPLHSYAMGGVASSPQMAIFGEGSTPEAYVPLPDGRTIPVTMRGGGGGSNVQVNVINQTNQQVTAEHSQPRFDGEKMILDVVLKGVSRPGTFRDGMKGSLNG